MRKGGEQRNVHAFEALLRVYTNTMSMYRIWVGSDGTGSLRAGRSRAGPVRNVPAAFGPSSFVKGILLIIRILDYPAAPNVNFFCSMLLFMFNTPIFPEDCQVRDLADEAMLQDVDIIFE